MNELKIEETSSDLFEEEEIHEIHKPTQGKNIYQFNIAIPQTHFSGEAAIAIVLLRWLPEYRNYDILRTDDDDVIEQCGIRLCYDHLPFSHETKTYKSQENLDIPGKPHKMSVAGLIYHFYGERAISTEYNLPPFDDDEDNKFLYNKIYKQIIYPLDVQEECDISRLSSILDPSDDPDPFVKTYTFDQLMNLIKEQFDQRINWITKTMLPERSFLRKSIDERKKAYHTGEILYLPHYVPIELNKDIIDPDENKKQTIKYIVMSRITNDAVVHTYKWRQNFKRLGLRGKSGEQLTALLQNISGSGWVHQNGTLAGWNTLQNALEYAKQVIKNVDK